MRTTSRAGMGTVIGIVLAIIGIAIIYIMGSDMIARGSRVTFERAIYSARAASVGEEAIKEVCFATANKKEFLKRMANSIGAAMQVGASTDPVADFLNYFDPDATRSASSSPPEIRYDPALAKGENDPRMDIPGFPSGQMWLTMENKLVDKLGSQVNPPRNWTNRVVFGDSSEGTFQATQTKQEREKEFESHGLKINEVLLRPVWFAVQWSGGGAGAARATVVVEMSVGRGNRIKKRTTIDHLFTLQKDPALRNPEPPGTTLEQRWQIQPKWDHLARHVENLGEVAQ